MTPALTPEIRAQIKDAFSRAQPDLRFTSAAVAAGMAAHPEMFTPTPPSDRAEITVPELGIFVSITPLQELAADANYANACDKYAADSGMAHWHFMGDRELDTWMRSDGLMVDVGVRPLGTGRLDWLRQWDTNVPLPGPVNVRRDGPNVWKCGNGHLTDHARGEGQGLCCPVCLQPTANTGKTREQLTKEKEKPLPAVWMVQIHEGQFKLMTTEGPCIWKLNSPPMDLPLHCNGIARFCGSTRTCEVHAFPLRDDNGRLIYAGKATDQTLKEQEAAGRDEDAAYTAAARASR